MRIRAIAEPPREGALPSRRRLLSAAALLFPASIVRADAREAAIGELLPDAPLAGLNGPSRRLSDYRGRALVINVWASWCGPCRMEMASLERLAWRDPDADFDVIGISTDDEAADAKAYLAGSHATISHFIDRNLQLERLLGASRIPLTVLVDRSGRIRDKVYGALEWDGPEALRRIRRAFGARPGGATLRS